MYYKSYNNNYRPRLLRGTLFTLVKRTAYNTQRGTRRRAAPVRIAISQCTFDLTSITMAEKYALNSRNPIVFLRNRTCAEFTTIFFLAYTVILLYLRSPCESLCRSENRRKVAEKKKIKKKKKDAASMNIRVQTARALNGERLLFSRYTFFGFTITPRSSRLTPVWIRVIVKWHVVGVFSKYLSIFTSCFSFELPRQPFYTYCILYYKASLCSTHSRHSVCISFFVVIKL